MSGYLDFLAVIEGDLSHAIKTLEQLDAFHLSPTSKQCEIIDIEMQCHMLKSRVAALYRDEVWKV